MLAFYLVLSIGVSFLCSLFEAVILSVTPAYAASLRETGKRSAILLDKLKTNIDDSLSAILTLNTVAHTIGAAGVGAEVLKRYGDEAVAIGSVILTLLILVLSEIIPKTLGATYYRSLSGFAANGIQIFIWLTYPFVLVFKQLSRLLGAGGNVHSAMITRDELMHSAEIVQQTGKLSNDEFKIIKNLLRLKKVPVSTVMTPRTVVFMLQADKTINEVLAENEQLNHTRIPIFQENPDDLIGLMNRYDLLQAKADGRGNEPLINFIKPFQSISDKTSIGMAYDKFKKLNEHLFIVSDEHGGFDGVISFEDVIETLLGIEITDEFDDIADLRAHAAEIWKQRKSNLSA